MNIKTLLHKFFNPPFSTSEMESSRTRSGVEFNIATMIYDDDIRYCPVTALGCVKTPKGHLLHVNWDRDGHCRDNGLRMTDFDLIRPTQNEIDSAKIVGGSVLTILVIVIFSIIL